ncbi:MAG: hypothetical protein LBC83_01260 [Oscillospiraceae bacterium]|jgi:alpha-mannosidase|nr:hypothetical protein [Oscillospiraceae bacterium]
MKKPSRIYTVATAHLDTSWHWTLEKTVAEMLPATLTKNFALFEKYPEYVFSFEGAYRYALMEEYYPELFARLREYIARNRWRVAGSCWENGDVNIPSPEALFRNILLGNDYFEEKFGKRSKDIYLPDCFGFGAALPGVAAHANLLGFTTQKLAWGSASPVPFGLGNWVAPDGRSILACPDGGNYTACLRKVRKHASMRLKLGRQLRQGLFPGALLLHGVGDQGGAPKESSVQAVVREIARNGASARQVLSAGSDQLFRDIAAAPLAVRNALPGFRGEWLLTDHGAGCYTSRAWSKRWNRKAEQLALAAESAACFADMAGRMAYPKQELNTAWRRVLAHHFHDDITGTSNEISYVRNWNDLFVSQQQFAETLRAGVSAVTAAMDAGFAVGRPAAVCNTTQWARSEAVRLALPQRIRGEAVRVVDAEGREYPAQVSAEGEAVLFLATVPPLSVTLFDVQLGESLQAGETALRADGRTLENQYIRARVDENGDICSLYDKRRACECLAAPVRLALFDFDGQPRYPQWELCYQDLARRPAEYPAAPELRLLESGPVRAALQIIRHARKSTFTQTLLLDAASEALRVECEIDWHSLRTLCKVEVPCAAASREAAYDIGFGVVRRGSNRRRLYEVPAQAFADISDANGGLTVLSDSKTGWDKPGGHTLRLTALYSPRASRADSHVLDFGRNRFAFGLHPHSGDWAAGDAPRAGALFNQPLSVFWAQGARMPGETASGETQACFGKISEGILLRCLKKSEQGGEYILRVQEGYQKACPLGRIRLGEGITGFREVYASEEPRPVPPSCAYLENGTLCLSLEPFEIRTFALQIKEAPRSLPAQLPVALPYNCRVACGQGENGGAAASLPAEQFPVTVYAGGVQYRLENAALENAVRCAGQSLELPAGRELRLLLASFTEDCEVAFTVDGQAHARTVRSALRPLGHGDLPGMALSGYAKAAAPALEFTHLHDAAGKDLVGRQAFFFTVELPLPARPCGLLLPDAEHVLLLAATVCAQSAAQFAAQPYDTFSARPQAECGMQLTPAEAAAKNAKQRYRKCRQNATVARNFLRAKWQVHFSRRNG